ncbi:uncharacterized protein SCHCODRAFT_02312822 [Schizophyllum commune H4-8]|uniref:uncharacterized protein n=1 Tax=Schizophyllum commune (strain H4-8 / FGSC 9210) TaxID=578458 RepID=UPI00215EA8E7|nr:uncharacterized protein SCHCODRAFT_02312822 [Schizophyllum commune H4-8]KAI5891202.1 hypothetical protein SCHCODRAFT_02312822 [Schizophyllum commune H4-8]
MVHPTAEPAVSPESPFRRRPLSQGARMLPSTYGPLYTRSILPCAYPHSCIPQTQAHMPSAFILCADTYLTSYLPSTGLHPPRSTLPTFLFLPRVHQVTRPITLPLASEARHPSPDGVIAAKARTR